MTDPSTFTVSDADLGLATDLYQLTMAAAHHGRDPLPNGTFELFIRHLPKNRNFLVFGGLEQALAGVRNLTYTEEQVGYLRSLPSFGSVPEDFFESLLSFRFKGDVWAMKEGSVFFPGEPVLRVTGSLIEAQLVETLLLSIVNFQTTIASKAARIRLAAGPGIELFEFGSRRAHGPQAAAWVARAAFLAGFDASSNVLAGQKTGIPVVGTMAHSFIMSYPDESTAFQRYLALFPDHAVLLVDTYDTVEGVREAIDLGRAFAGVRLDSGDIGSLAAEVRRLLDAKGRHKVKIYASGDMNEERIARLLADGAPIDAFGVGTRLATSADSPYVGGIYKLVELEEGGEILPKFKASIGKVTYPGRKQVLRRIEEGEMRGDRIVSAMADLPTRGHEPLLRPVMRDGEILESESLESARRHCRSELSRLPARLRQLEPAEHPYPVHIDPSIMALLSGSTRPGVI